MTQRDIKLLWGRSGNCCAICKKELSHDKKHSSEKYPLGEQAHIVGENERSARWKSNLSDPEREGYHNRILLCPTHHVEIDNDEGFYSVERLHMIKQEHELWRQERLSGKVDEQKQAQDLVYAALVDSAVRLCAFFEWNGWVAQAGRTRPAWYKPTFEGVGRFHDLVFRAAWPGTNHELEKSLRTLAISLENSRKLFSKHCDYGRVHTNVYAAIPFYSSVQHTQEKYDELLEQYEQWETECFFWLWIATKAANWVSEVVRRDINPMFFALEGKFVFEGDINEANKTIPQFDEAEKARLPDGIEVLFNNYWHTVERGV